MTFNEFKNNVELWAAERGIYDHSTVLAQALKAISEAGEMADAVIKNDHLALADAIGDVAVCLVNVAAMSGIEVAVLDAGVTEGDAKEAAVAICLSVAEVADCALNAPECNDALEQAIHLALAVMRVLAMSEGTTLEACCDAAWNEIKDRKGRMVAGGAFVKDEDEQKQDGGPAFPQGKGVGDVWVSDGGMTLRDYFAAKAMQSIISRMSSAQYNYNGAEDAASDAYAFADAMIKERNK